MQKINYLLVLLVLSVTFLASCSKDDEGAVNPTTENAITAEDFATTIDENVENGSSLGVIEAAVSSGSVAFELVSQEPEGAIALNSNTGELTVADASLFDFETNPVIKAEIDISAEGVESKRITANVTLKNVEEKMPAFITTWKTLEDNESITIPVNSEEFTYSYTVNWGDGNIEEGITGNATHTFASAGTHTVEITGDFPAIYFYFHDGAHKLHSIEQWGDIAWKSMGYAFAGCENLDIRATDAPDLSQVTYMLGMFWDAVTMNGDLNSWDVSNVTDMRAMFNNTPNFNQDISNWNVGKVTTMRSMFEGASAFNQNLSNWNVGAVTNMNAMFRKASAFNQNLNNWDVSQVRDMNSMFAGASSFNGDISAWSVGNVENMGSLLYYVPFFNKDLSDWDVSKVSRMSDMFAGASQFNSDLSEWDVSNVTSMGGMFSAAASFNSDLSGWDVSQVVHMSGMFAGASAFKGDLSNWDVNHVQYMDGMFANATSFNSDLSNWDVSNVTDMNGMFYHASSFNANLGKWNISKIDDLNTFFASCGMSIGNYNATLHGWSQLTTVQHDVNLNAYGLKYCAIGETARNVLIGKGWSFYGDAKASAAECL